MRRPPGRCVLALMHQDAPAQAFIFVVLQRLVVPWLRTPCGRGELDAFRSENRPSKRRLLNAMGARVRGAGKLPMPDLAGLSAIMCMAELGPKPRF